MRCSCWADTCRSWGSAGRLTLAVMGRPSLAARWFAMPSCCKNSDGEQAAQEAVGFVRQRGVEGDFRCDVPTCCVERVGLWSTVAFQRVARSGTGGSGERVYLPVSQAGSSATTVWTSRSLRLAGERVFWIRWAASIFCRIESLNWRASGSHWRVERAGAALVASIVRGVGSTGYRRFKTPETICSSSADSAVRLARALRVGRSRPFGRTESALTSLRSLIRLGLLVVPHAGAPVQPRPKRSIGEQTR